MPDEQQMKPSEPEQTASPEPAAQPEPAVAAEPSQPTQEDPQPAESADRDAQPSQAEQSAPEQASDEQAQPPSPAEAPEPAAPEQEPAPEAGADADPGAEGPSIDEVIRERDAHRGDLLRVKAEAEGPSIDEVIRERDYWRLTAAELKTKLDRTESENSEKIKPGDLLGDLLPVVDDLERAVAADTGDGESYRRGVEGVQRKLLDVMARRGVAPIEALGADFDPNLHEAMTSEPADGRRDGEVVEELRRGYTLRGKLLRPSMVKVAKA